ncbi:hypothetical protein [Streptomyces durhamensis]|uniref:hypothetical protein n=1 Tax=Streptomyces durhamensis TaxID=68194 RepID=UPI0006900705|nr:hypothetical protein [Streptomyces durhamensis]
MTGHTAAVLAVSLTAGREVYADVPGPLGLPGGYRVRIGDGRVALDLPPGLSCQEAVAWQVRMADHDSVTVLPSGDVCFGARAHQALMAHLPVVGHVQPAKGIAGLTDRLFGLREALRAQSPRLMASQRR